MEFKNVSKWFKDKKVLDEANFVLREGEFFTLIGPGKTSVLKLMAGTETPSKGEVAVFGADPFHFEFRERSDIFFIHNQYHLFFPKNLLEMIKYYRTIFPRWSNQNFNKMLKDRKFSIKKNFSELSESKQYELLVMMALASRPKIILIDDIHTLNKEALDYFLPLLKKYTSFGGTVIVSADHSSEFLDYSDQFLCLEESRIMMIKLEKPDETLVA